MTGTDAAVVGQASGERRVMSVDEAGAALREAERTHNHNRQRVGQTKSRLRKARIHLWLAGLPPFMRMEGWVFALAIATGLALVFGLLTVMFDGSIILALSAVLVAYVVLLAAAPRVFPADLRPLREAAEHARREVDSAEATAREGQQQFNEARRIHDALVCARDSMANHLLTAEPRLMSGDQFEVFLAGVFQFRGCAVQRTGKTGDQGVDLIVTLGVVRAAIQAKCYAETVSNAAVQEVFAGMRFHDCNKCAVVTSGHFSRGATELAEKIGCVLIARDDIHKLIRGEICV